MIIKKRFYNEKRYFKEFIWSFFSTMSLVLGFSNNFFKDMKYKFISIKDHEIGCFPFLTIKKTGDLACNACMLCTYFCPSKCIHLTPNTNDKLDKNRRPTHFEIDILRCVSCGACVEACPVDAIRLSVDECLVGVSDKNWAFTENDLIYRSTLEKNIGCLSKYTARKE